MGRIGDQFWLSGIAWKPDQRALVVKEGIIPALCQIEMDTIWCADYFLEICHQVAVRLGKVAAPSFDQLTLRDDTERGRVG